MDDIKHEQAGLDFFVFQVCQAKCVLILSNAK